MLVARLYHAIILVHKFITFRKPNYLIAEFST